MGPNMICGKIILIELLTTKVVHMHQLEYRFV